MVKTDTVNSSFEHLPDLGIPLLHGPSLFHPNHLTLYPNNLLHSLKIAEP